MVGTSVASLQRKNALLECFTVTSPECSSRSILLAQHPSSLLQAYLDSLVAHVDLEELRLRMSGNEVLENQIEGFKGVDSTRRDMDLV
jgi:hypothetical protein